MSNAQQRPPSQSPPPVSAPQPSAVPQARWLSNFFPSLTTQSLNADYLGTTDQSPQMGTTTGFFQPRQSVLDPLLPPTDLGETLQLLTLALPKRPPFVSIWNDSGVRRMHNDNSEPFQPFGDGESAGKHHTFNVGDGHLSGSLNDYNSLSSGTPRAVPAMPRRLVPGYNIYLARVNNPSFVPSSSPPHSPPPQSPPPLLVSTADLGLAHRLAAPVTASAPEFSTSATVLTPGAATSSPVKAKKNARSRVLPPPGLHTAQSYWLQPRGFPHGSAPHALPLLPRADSASSDRPDTPPLSTRRPVKRSMLTREIVVNLPRKLGSAKPAGEFHFNDVILLQNTRPQNPQHKEYCSTFYKRNNHGYMFVREPTNSLKVNSNGVGSKSWVQLKVNLPSNISTTTTTTTTTTTMTTNVANTSTSTVTTSTARKIKVDVRQLPHWKPAASAKTKRSRWRELLGSASRESGRRAKRTRP